MKSRLRFLVLGLALLAPLAASAQAPTVSAISDVSLDAGTNRTVNVVAFSAGTPITLTASLPAFATLNGPTSGTGSVVTTISLVPTAANVGTFNAGVTATSGASSSTENFVITVNAAGTNQAPVVSAPALQNATVGTMLTFNVTATDSEDITSLGASGLPSGATFSPNGTSTAGTFSWTPADGQTGDFDVVFTAMNSMSGSATTHIHVRAATNSVPTLDAPASRTVTEGQTVAFTVTATDADGDHVTLTTGALPSGATATDQGDNTLSFSWQPDTNQAGTYTVTFNGDDGHGGTVSATTTITVLDSGTGGGTGQATVTLIGIVNTHNDRTCFRIKPVHDSFDVRDVNLSSVTLQFDGQSIVAARTQVQTDCDDESGDDDSHDGARALLRDGPGHEEEGGDDCGDCSPDSCDATAMRACFSTGALLTLFGDSIQDSLGSATIHFTLSNGTEIVATFQGMTLVSRGKGHAHFMNAAARPNPLNPRTTLTFTLSQPGRVQVSVYDMQGRLVNRLLDENRAAGPQSVVWDGSNSREGHVSSGVYFFRIQAPEGHVIQRVAVVK
jgi:hypothetical protein